MEGDAGVGANALLAGAEGPEVLGGHGDDVTVELHHDPPLELPANADVQVAPRPRHLLFLPFPSACPSFCLHFRRKRSSKATTNTNPREVSAREFMEERQSAASRCHGECTTLLTLPPQQRNENNNNNNK